MAQTWFELQKFWNNCTQCGLAQTCIHHVVGSGSLPCEILVIGEGPGAHEDATGEPFTGHSGVFLRQAMLDLHMPVVETARFFFTNLVACRPHDKMDSPNRPPTMEEILSCAPRLHQIWELAHPLGIIFLGRMAQHHGRLILFHRIKSTTVLDLPQPAALLRRGGVIAEDYPDYLMKLRIFFENVYALK